MESGACPDARCRTAARSDESRAIVDKTLRDLIAENTRNPGDNLIAGLIQEATNNGAVLGANFPGDAWYSDAYKLLTDSGLKPAVEPLKAGTKKNILDRLIKDKDTTLAPPGEGKSKKPGIRGALGM